jgi:uncharacterized membrane protein YjjP (DUF1212 family)
MWNQAREQLVAYLATLAALMIVFIAALIAGAVSPALIGKIEAFGLGTITGGLIGVLRLPQQRSMTIDNPENDPVPTKDAK